MAHAQPNSTLQESEITDNTDDLEVEDVFNLKFPMSPMSNSEIEQFSQQLDDSELLMQTEREEMSQNAAADVEATQCEEADQMLSERGQRSENHKNKAQLQKEKVTEAQAKLNEKLKRKAENDPVKRPKTKPQRTDCSPVCYFYDVIKKENVMLYVNVGNIQLKCVIVPRLPSLDIYVLLI